MRQLDYETLSLLGEAYDKALASIHRAAQAPIVRETMAIRLLEMANQGERDPERLCRAALCALGSRL